MIYITGDCHGDFRRFTNTKCNALPLTLTEKDYVIVCGDLGLLWKDDKTLQYNLKCMLGLPFTLLWVQGNHENYNMIEEYKLEKWKGGKVRHIIKDKIILLERGQIFNIEGKSFFTFGGASSHDIQGGILDVDSPTYTIDCYKARKRGLAYRVNNVSWWKQELPTPDEIAEARLNLLNVGYKVDYVITHCASNYVQNYITQDFMRIGDMRVYDRDILTDFFDELDTSLEYSQWYCGHYHTECSVDDKHTILYMNIISLK